MPKRQEHGRSSTLICGADPSHRTSHTKQDLVTLSKLRPVSDRGCVERVAIALVFLTLAAPVPSSAQEIPALACITPMHCIAAERSEPMPLVMELVGKLPSNTSRSGIKVIFTSVAGGQTDSATTDSSGVARVLWRAAGVSGADTIRVAAVVGRALVTQAIEIGIGKATFSLPRTGDARWYDQLWAPEPQWYVSRQLKTPLKATLVIPAGQRCERNGVVFHAMGDGAMAWPDTAWGEIDRTGNCVAIGRVKLGPTVGRYAVRVTLVGDKRQYADYRATARGLPWVGLGIAFTSNSEFLTLSREKSALKITRKLAGAAPGESVEVSYDSTRVSAAAVDSVKHQWAFTPVIGVNFAPVLRLRWLRTFVGADTRNPTGNWYLGASLLQMTSGFEQEDVGVDLHLVGQISRRAILPDNAGCEMAAKTCLTENHTRFVGWGAILAVNANSVFEKLYTALLPK